MTLWTEEGRSDVRVSLREPVCVISVIACIFTLKNKLFCSCQHLGRPEQRRQAEMERARHRPQVMLLVMAEMVRAGKH